MEFKIEETSEGKRLQDAINQLKDCEAKIGWFENDVYDNKYKTPVATVVVIQENGAVLQTNHFERFQQKIGPHKKENIQRHNRKYKNVSGDFSQVVVIPPRPFIEPALKKNQNKFFDIIDSSSQQILDNSLTVYRAFENLAQATRNAIQNEIKTVSSPPLSDATIKNRLSKRKDKQRTSSIEKPLIDTGHMFQTISTKVTTL